MMSSTSVTSPYRGGHFQHKRGPTTDKMIARRTIPEAHVMKSRNLWNYQLFSGTMDVPMDLIWIWDGGTPEHTWISNQLESNRTGTCNGTQGDETRRINPIHVWVLNGPCDIIILGRAAVHVPAGDTAEQEGEERNAKLKNYLGYQTCQQKGTGNNWAYNRFQMGSLHRSGIPV